MRIDARVAGVLTLALTFLSCQSAGASSAGRMPMRS